MLKGQKVEVGGKTPYQKWVESQEIPVIRDFYIEDLRTVPLQPWAFRGGSGAIINLIGTGDLNEGYLSEIPPGGSLKPLRMMYEETVFVIEGNGSTAIWTDEKKKVTFEWGPGAIFAPPLNTWRQHFNASGAKAGAPSCGDVGATGDEHVPQHGFHLQQQLRLQRPLRRRLRKFFRCRRVL